MENTKTKKEIKQINRLKKMLEINSCTQEGRQSIIKQLEILEANN